VRLRVVAALAAVAVLGFYAVNVVHYGDLPLRIEESEWPPMAEAIARTGKPVLAAADTHRVRFNASLQVDPSPLIGAWHPPLYQYATAGVMLVAGTDTTHGLRIVGALGLLVSAVLLLLIAREVTPRWRLIGGVSAGLLLLHPYAIQGSMFLDIDNTVYGPLALLVLWLAVRFGGRPGALAPSHILLLGLALALVTWAKMTTTIILVAVLVAWWILARRPVLRAAYEIAASVATGAALFASSYWLWCRVTNIPFSYTFDVTFVQKSNRLFSDWWISENAAHWHVRWFGLTVLALALVYLVDLLRNFAATRRLRELDLLFLFALGVIANYILVSPTDGTYQGKYAFPAIGALLLPITWMLLREADVRSPGIARWAGAAAIGLVAALLVPDLVTNLSVNGVYGNWGVDLLVLGGVVVALGAAWLLNGASGFGGGVVVVLALLLVSQTVDSYRADSSPLYPVSDTADFRAGVADINASMEPGDIVVAPKDLGFYVDGQVIEGEDAFARGDALLADVIRSNPQVVAVARTSFGPPMGPNTTGLVDRCFLDRRAFGSVLLAYRSGNCN
jgi:hypothetical protein